MPPPRPACPGRLAAVPPGMLVIEGALALIVVGAVITVIQRVLHVRTQAAGEPPERTS